MKLKDRHGQMTNVTDLTDYLYTVANRDGFAIRSDEVDLWVCTDCHMVANIPLGELGDYEERRADYDRCERALEEIGNVAHVAADLYSVPDSVVSALWKLGSGDYPAAEIDFTWTRCHLCDSTLGGARYPYVTVGRD